MRGKVALLLAAIYILAATSSPAAMPFALQRARSVILLPPALVKLGLAKVAVFLTRLLVSA